MSNTSGYNTETIYGTHEDANTVMSEKVQSLAGTIYQEFEKMIARYDEDVVKSLMPLVVNVLECLDHAHQTNQLHEVELELLKEDNEQLITQYEREKGGRKYAEQKLLESEDVAEGEKKELQGRLQSIESIVKMLELKYKNSMDHVCRLEERENELKKEYAKLHERYTELFKTHVDYMERSKMLLSTAGDRGEVRGRFNLGNQLPNTSGHLSFGFASLEGADIAEHTESILVLSSPGSVASSPSPTLGVELARLHTNEQAHQTDAVDQQNQATSPVTMPKNKGKYETTHENTNTRYERFCFNENNANVVDSDDTAHEITVSDNFFGMGKEVENLIMENKDLLATKNALNVVKDDLIVKVDELTAEQEILRAEVSILSGARETLREKVTQLEDELKQLKVAVGSGAGAAEGGEEEADVPMAQRKRFTRVEMARVLMERNQYKERLMELQDAVHWTEMVRASRSDASLKKNKQTIWTFFSKLFTTSDRPQRPLSTPHLRSVGSPLGLRHSQTQDFLQTQLTDHHRRNTDRGEQFRQVRAHVRKEDGRTQAYGWSLPSKSGQNKGPSPCTSFSSGGVPVPVPVFCRPISDSEPKMTLLCAAGVNLCGGATPDGGCMIGESVFYSKDSEVMEKVVSLAEELSKAQCHHSPEVEEISRHLESTHGSDATEKHLSSLVWICASTPTHGVIMIIDANNPSEVIESFSVSDKHVLCVASVPGATAEDYKEYEERMVANERKDYETQSRHNSGDFQCTNNTFTYLESKDVVVGSTSLVQAIVSSPPTSPEVVQSLASEPPKEARIKSTEQAGDCSPPLRSTPVADSPEPAVDAFAQEQASSEDKEDMAQDRKMSTVLATMWIGTKSGFLYVHSAVANYSKCLARVNLTDAIISIVHCSSRTIVALADGTVAIFFRLADGQWDFSQYHLLILGDPKCSVRCLSVVGCTVWCGFRNKVHVVEPRSRVILHTLEAHPRHESQVRQMAWVGDGVWVSIKMDSTLRLYHAHTYQHLMDVDIEPYVSKMLGAGKLGFSFVRITALLISSGRLWIGTSNGVVISVPLSDFAVRENPVPASHTSPVPGSCVVSPGSLIPSCSMAHAQLSFHGHRDAVTFFVAVPGVSSPTAPTAMLVLSGGEGYVDFRTADSEMEDSVVVVDEGHNSSEGVSTLDRMNRSHLIVWQVAQS